MLAGITRFAIAAPRRVVAVAAAMLVGAAVFGLPVVNKLSGGGFQDPTSQSSRATDLLRKKFHHTDQQMLIVVTDPAGAQSSQARRVATDIVDGLKRSPWVLNVSSAWTSPPPTAAQLVSKDGKSGMIAAGLKGGENKAQDYASTLMHQLVHDRDGVTVRAGGMAVAYAEINQQNERDLVLMEAIAVPLSFAVLVWVLGGVVAAALPVAVGVLSIVGTMSVLRLISFSTEVSTYALDLSVAMGLALAIDYNLLIISRYREEFARSGDRDRALVRTMATAGRTVLFSATTVGLSMAVMALFPMYFLKSSAYTIVATAVIVAVAAVVVTPAVIALLGPRLDALDARELVRRLLPAAAWLRDHAEKPVTALFWYRSTRFVLRHAVPAGLSVVALLMLLGAPFLGVKWGFPDERVLPRSASARQVADMLDHDFPNAAGNSMSVVLPDAHGVTPADMQRYAAELSRIPDVSAVTAPTGTFVAGNLAGPPAAPTGMAHGSAFLTVASTAPLYSAASNTQLDRLHATAAPGGRSVEITGLAQINRDSVAAITQRLPAVLVLIALITFVLLFMLTGSAVIPLQALVCNVLSLTAAFGAMVWIFQDGHLGALGTTPNGTLNANIPVLLFCIALGLAMDYEVFLVSRIHEYWLASQAAHDTRPSAAQARAATDESTALGIAGIGRVVTTAALVMSISFAALIPAQVSFMRMLGVGLTLAVLADATLVRMVLVPAFLHLLGRWTWWAPTPLAWLRERSVTGEEGARAVGRRRWAVDAAQPAAGFTGWPDGRPESSGRPHGPVSEPSAAATTAFAGFRAEHRFSDAQTRGGSAPAARVEPRAWTATPAYYRRGDDRRATGHPWRYPEPSTNRLLRQLKPAPSQGWRRWVYTLSGRLINPGESPRVIRYRGLAAYANRPFRGCYKIAVVSLKGGVGKTTITACLGATFASIRGDRVVAVDANPDHGTLGQRVPRETPATVRHLLRDAEGIRHYGDVRSYTNQGRSRLEVLASESDPAISEAFSAEDYYTTLDILQRFYGLVLTDCGTGLLQSAMSAVLATTDCLIVVSSASIDGARSASATLDWLDAHGHQDLVRGAIAVINGVRPRSGRVDMQKVIDHFARRCRAVRLVPFDPHLEEGAEISLDRLKRATREALIELAAVVADGFPAVERLSTAFV